MSSCGYAAYTLLTASWVLNPVSASLPTWVGAQIWVHQGFRTPGMVSKFSFLRRAIQYIQIYIYISVSSETLLVTAENEASQICRKACIVYWLQGKFLTFNAYLLCLNYKTSVISEYLGGGQVKKRGKVKQSDLELNYPPEVFTATSNNSCGKPLALKNILTSSCLTKFETLGFCLSRELSRAGF